MFSEQLVINSLCDCARLLQACEHIYVSIKSNSLLNSPINVKLDSIPTNYITWHHTLPDPGEQQTQGIVTTFLFIVTRKHTSTSPFDCELSSKLRAMRLSLLIFSKTKYKKDQEYRMTRLTNQLRTAKKIYRLNSEVKLNWRHETQLTSSLSAIFQL